jgi:hypothetical protein
MLSPRSIVLTISLLAMAVSPYAACAAGSFDLTVMPPEHTRTVDRQTGVELLFLATAPGEDSNLYCEQRSWLADSSFILFHLGRKKGGLTGYLAKTGELVRLVTPNGSYGGATAARNRNSIYGVQNGKLVELALDIHTSDGPATTPSRVRGTERVICELGPVYRSVVCALTESCDGKFLCVAAGGGPEETVHVLIVNVESGAIREVRRVKAADFHGHVMFSLTNPNLLSYKGEKDLVLQVVDLRTGGTVCQQGLRLDVELATHHCWWANDTITFCGGFHRGPNEDSDVKVMNIYTGEIRIIGRGSWWAGGTPSQLAAYNWWHAAGHESGRWVAADNWHGDIGLFHGRTARTYILTKGHRTYGGGAHPHVGWDRKGEQVIFASHMLDGVHVCVATIPKQWQDDWAKP